MSLASDFTDAVVVLENGPALAAEVKALLAAVSGDANGTVKVANAAAVVAQLAATIAQVAAEMVEK